MKKTIILIVCFVLFMLTGLTADLQRKGRQSLDNPKIATQNSKITPGSPENDPASNPPEISSGPQECPSYLPPGTPSWMWESEVWWVWYCYYQSKVYHYYFGGTSIFDE